MKKVISITLLITILVGCTTIFLSCVPQIYLSGTYRGVVEKNGEKYTKEFVFDKNSVTTNIDFSDGETGIYSILEDGDSGNWYLTIRYEIDRWGQPTTATISRSFRQAGDSVIFIDDVKYTKVK